MGVAMVNSGNQPEFVTDASVLVWNPGSPNKEKWDSLVRFGPDPMAQALPVIIRAGETALIQAIGTGDDKVYRVEDLRPASSGRSKEFEIGVGVNVKTSAGNNSNVRFPVGRASLNAEGGATVYSVITPAFRFIDALETSAFSPSLTLGGPPMRIR